MMRILIEVIDKPAEESVLRNNVNPIRVGLLLVRLIETVTEQFQYSKHTTSVILTKFKEQLVAMLDTYIQPTEVMRLI